MKHTLLVLASALVLVLSPACSSVPSGPESGVPVHSTIRDSSGKMVGTLDLTQEAGGVRMELVAHGLTPGRHGLHFHETGKCEGMDFKSAGKHFAAAGSHHGDHWGDLPNLEVAADGSAQLDFVATHVTLTPGERSLLKEGGTSLMIHAGPDDMKTDPAGNSGDRIACAVISK